MCDAACIKNIINGQFMATLAPILAESTSNAQIRDAAKGLGIAAAAQAEMFDALGFIIASEERSASFSGCAQAQALVKWIVAGSDVANVDKMLNWTADIWKSIADLAAGKLST